MRRRFIADTWTNTTAALTGDQAVHLARVLRAEPGQVYDIVANGFVHRAEIVAVSDKEVTFALHEELEADAARPLHLLLAVFKFDHFEWAVEKATELGVARITPVVARRTEKHLALTAAKRAERWRRIVLEAAKQSRRTDVPEIAEPVSLKLALDAEKSDVRILLSETEQVVGLGDAVREETVSRGSGGATYALAIGPEGGWTPEEMGLFGSQGWRSVTLGPRILRAETAAIAGIAIVSSYLA
jgi:16S rRNA (uracil1498-N3)-methyltransferase